MEENKGQGLIKPTIVGVRPPEGRVDFKSRPIGIEILLKKAKVDREFKMRLLKERAPAAAGICLRLEPEETAILNSIPEDQLSQMIDRTEVREEIKSVFEKYIAAAMVAALGLTPMLATGCRVTPAGVISDTNTPVETPAMTPAQSATATATSTIDVISTATIATPTPSATSVGTTVPTPTRTSTPTVTATP